MPTIPNTGIIGWPSTHASIPSGYTRYTALDGRFPKGWGAEAVATNGGAATHTHTSPVHSHTLDTHVHSGTLSTVGRTGDNTNGTSDAQILNNDHYHTFSIGGVSGGTITDACSYGAFSNDPPYYEMIFIQAVGAQPIPNGAVVWFDNTTDPATYGGLTFCDGAGGTPDLRNKFLKGAATSGNAGGTGGNTVNTHDISHSHTPVSHTHSGNSSNTIPDTAKDRQYSTAQTCVWHSHTHTVTLNAGIQSVNAFSGSLVTAETVEPVYKKLLPYKNTSGGSKNALGVYCMWVGSVTATPSGTALADGTGGTRDMRDYYLKCANTTGEIGNTGGSNTHAHAAQSHVHTSSGTHTHSGGTVSNHQGADDRIGNGTPVASPNNQHTITACDSVAASYAAANTTADTTNNEPLYRTVAYIKVLRSVGGASLLAQYYGM